MDATGTISAAAIAKRLASCSGPSRDRAVRALASWLPAQDPAAVSDGDLLKLWKGLFYCVWHADKAPAQAALAGRLAALLPALPPPLATRYLAATLLTLRREWSGIDHLRLDKFYLLLRRFLRHLFLLLQNRSWDLDLTVQMISVLQEKSFLAADKYPAGGVNYQIAEVFLDEVKEFLPLPVEIIDVIIKPFVLAMEKSPDKVLVNKIKMNVFDRLLENGRGLLDLQKVGDQVESGSDGDKFGKIALALNFAKKFFESASASETLQGNRKVLFSLHESFLKLEKDLEKSGVHISIQHLEDGESEEVPELIPLENTEQVDVEMGCSDGGSDEQPSKKKKKKSMKAADGNEKRTKSKKKNKKKKSLDSVTNSDVAELSSDVDNAVNTGNVNGDSAEIHSLINFDECVMSTLQKQFEKAAAEAGMVDASERLGTLGTTPLVLKKRKRAKSAGRHATDSEGIANGGSAAGKSGEKSAKKVRFSMKSNLVWKPQSPLPPQSLRLPPSATPRGSALKKGVPPGPIRETPPTVKKIKAKGSSLKKAKKSPKSIFSAVKRLRKLQSLSV